MTTAVGHRQWVGTEIKKMPVSKKIILIKSSNELHNFENSAKISFLLTFTELKLVENGSLTGGVETDHQNTHLFLAEL